MIVGVALAARSMRLVLMVAVLSAAAVLAGRTKGQNGAGTWMKANALGRFTLMRTG